MPDRQTSHHGLCDACRFQARLPHWGWFLAAAVILIICGAGLRIGAHVYHQRTARETIDRVGGRIVWERHGPAWLQGWLVSGESGEISPFDDIVEVDMSNEQVTDADLKALSSLSRVTTLELAGAKITDSGLTLLGALGKLESLDLRDTGVTEAGLVHLRGMNRLERVDLPGFKLTEQGLRTLCDFPNLKEVTLHGGKLANPEFVDVAGTRGFDLYETDEVDFFKHTQGTLRGRKKVTLVYCYAPKELKFDNESVDYDLAKHVAYQLNGNEIKVVDPDRVYGWLDKNRTWKKPSEIGAAFKCDYIVHIDILDYSLFEANSTYLNRGRADLLLNVIKMDEDRQDGTVIYTHAIKSNFPIRGPIDSDAMPLSEFKKRYLSFLSDKIGRLFYPAVRLKLKRK